MLNTPWESIKRRWRITRPAVRRNPEGADTYYRRGSAQYALGDYKAALEDYSQVHLQKAANIYKEQGQMADYQRVQSQIDELRQQTNRL